MIRNLPKWIWLMTLRKLASNRPQVAFLPLVEDKGSVKPVSQPSLSKTRLFKSNDSHVAVPSEDSIQDVVVDVNVR